MGQTIIRDPRRVFSQSGGEIDPSIDTRITKLEDNEYKILYFEAISSTTGTITKPTNSTILLDQFYSGGDAIVETLVNGQPSGQSPLTAGGSVVSVSSFDTSGNFTLSGTPSSYPVALIYIFTIKAVDYSNVVKANEMNMENNGLAPLASPTFTGVATFQNIIRLTSASLGTAVAGNIEFLTDKFYGVITTGTSRKEFVLADTALTSGRLLFTTTNGRLTDSANLLFDTSNARLTIGSTTPPFQRDFVITKNNNGAVAFLVDNQSAGNAAFSGFNFVCGTTTLALVNYSQGYTGSFGNTNITVASTSYFNTASRNAKLMFGGNPIYFITGNADTNIAIGHSTTGVRIDTSINIHNAATARLHIGAGTATAGTAPLKLTSGTNLTTPENGAFEYDGTNLYFTTGGVRKTVTLV